jgi:membrane dipeptidase
MALASAVGAAKHDLERYVDHVEHAISVAGPEHVCVGGDFMAQLVRSGSVTITPRELATLPPGVEPGAAVEGLAGPQDYPALAEALSRRGHDDATIAALLHGNLVRFRRGTLPAG